MKGSFSGKDSLERIVAWVVAITLRATDGLISIMLRTRSDERRIRPTKRVTWPRGLKQELMKQQDNTCVYCGHRRIARSLEIDHIVPAVRGGSNGKSNLQVICRPCNQRKGLQTDQEFRSRYSRLIPATPLTPPQRRVLQNEFTAETQRTTQSASVQQFRKTRFISKSTKIVSGSTILGLATGAIMLLLLSSLGAGGLLLLLPAVALGAAIGFGVWYRAFKTGAMIEDDS